MAAKTKKAEPEAEEHFFRIKRKKSGYVTEGIAVVGGVELRRWEVHDWDTLKPAQDKLLTHAMKAMAVRP